MEMTIRVRKGGLQTSGGFLFELNGGHVALDLANTIDVRRAAEPRELLGSYDDLLNWARQCGLLSETDVQTLARESRKRAQASARALRRAIALRETIFGMFEAAAEGRRISAEALRRFETLVHDAASRRSLSTDGTSVRWIWRVRENDLDWFLWPVIEAAADLLTSDRLGRVRVCQDPICAWLFIDHSPRGNRRWCDMSVCGNRAKAKRHYERSKKSKGQ